MAQDKLLPFKITPDPILDSVVELRFATEYPKDTITSKLISILSNEFPQFLPSNVPKEYRENKEYEFAVEATVRNDHFSVGVGHNVITFNCVNGYKGWDKYFQTIKESLEKVKSANIVSNIFRIGVRYINFFPGLDDISKNINLSIYFGVDNPYELSQLLLITTIRKGDFQHLIRIADNASINTRMGSVIDIDTSSLNTNHNISEALLSTINQARQEEKLVFFNLLKQDFLSRFSPEYNK